MNTPPNVTPLRRHPKHPGPLTGEHPTHTCPHCGLLIELVTILQPGCTQPDDHTNPPPCTDCLRR